MIEIRVDVRAEEVLLRLDLLPRRLRAVAKAKMEQIFAAAPTEFKKGIPGKYIDPATIQSGVDEIGSLVIGYIEAPDKPGVYTILPLRKPMLVNLKQRFFAHAVYFHPYPKAAPAIERYLAENKPWIIEQLEDAIYGAL